MKNFHLPLPEHTYALLRAEAEQTQVPATVLAREAIDSWLNLETAVKTPPSNPPSSAASV